MQKAKCKSKLVSIILIMVTIVCMTSCNVAYDNYPEDTTYDESKIDVEKGSLTQEESASDNHMISIEDCAKKIKDRYWYDIDPLVLASDKEGSKIYTDSGDIKEYKKVFMVTKNSVLFSDYSYTFFYDYGSNVVVVKEDNYVAGHGFSNDISDAMICISGHPDALTFGELWDRFKQEAREEAGEGLSVIKTFASTEKGIEYYISKTTSGELDFNVIVRIGVE